MYDNYQDDGYDETDSPSSFFMQAFPSLIAIICLLLISISIMIIRGKFRRIFSIRGDGCEDCCCSFFCSCCVISQMASHVKLHTNGAPCFGPPETLPGYIN